MTSFIIANGPAPVAFDPDHPRTRPALAKRLTAYADLTVAEDIAIERLLAANVRIVQGRTMIVEEGAPQSEISVMLSGWACRYKTHDGLRQIVALHLPGDVCDFNALLMPAADTAIEAVCDARIATISRHALGQLTAHYPRVSQALWWESLVSASVQREWMVNVCRRNARERVAHLFCEIAARLVAAGCNDAEDVGFELPLTQIEIGNACSMTPEHASRVLRELRETGLCSLDRGMLAITDREALADFARFDARYLHARVGEGTPYWTASTDMTAQGAVA